MLRPTLFALALAGTVLAVPAAAQNTRSAALAQLRAEFAASDVNRDGVLTRNEVAARIERMRLAGVARPLTAQQARQLTDLWFGRTDADHDGRVTPAEAAMAMGAEFDRYDTNRDGVVSPAERQAAHAAIRPPTRPR